jgi:hypothetical protein
MSIDLAAPGLSPLDLVSLTQASDKLSPALKAKAKDAAQNLEAVFLNSMFNSMFTGIDGDGPFGGNGTSGVWRAMLHRSICAQLRQRRRRRHCQSRLPEPARATGGEPMSAERAIGNAAEAERAVTALHAAMDELAEVLAQETELLRKGGCATRPRSSSRSNRVRAPIRRRPPA